MNERKNWIEAEEKFRKDINAIIISPSCGKGNLIAFDVLFDNNDIKKGGERIIQCSVCGKYEAIFYRKLPGNWNSQNPGK